MATEVCATIDGIVKHRHGGIKGWHNADIRHYDATLHQRERVDQPAGVANLTDAGRAQFKEALDGKSFEYLWEPGREKRRAQRKALGLPEWIHHGPKPR